tara:strand:+ start:551 stop:829 length:279 start_codon:yes stop_codon:yes gene_type:complete
MSEVDDLRMRPPTINSMVDFQKMVFIYNAVNDGWTVKVLPDGRYEFRKLEKRITSDQCLDEYLKKFIGYYMKLKLSQDSTTQFLDNNSNQAN